jgi:hypothetical protein
MPRKSRPRLKKRPRKLPDGSLVKVERAAQSVQSGESGGNVASDPPRMKTETHAIFLLVEMFTKEDQQRLDEIERQIEEVKRSLPAHSIPAAMLLTSEDLEDQRERLLAKRRDDRDAAA